MNLKIVYWILAPLFLVGYLTGCSGCYAPGRPPVPPAHYGWDDQGDHDAAAVQDAMRTVVTVHQDFVYKLAAPGPDKSLMGIARGGGSGFVVARRNGHTLVMSAAHVCRTPAELDLNGLKVPVAFSTFRIRYIEDKIHPATVLWMQKDPGSDDDLCLLDSPDGFGQVAVVADRTPPQGARVFHVGSPLKNWDVHMRYVSEGRFCGYQALAPGTLFETFSTPSAPGGSGGGIWYHGRVVGVLVMVERGFNDVTQAVRLDHIRADLQEALETWQKTATRQPDKK